MTVLKPNSLLVTGTNAGDTDPGLKITFGATASAGQGAFAFQDYLNAPIFTITKTSNGQTACYGDYLRAYPTLAAAIAAAGVGFDGIRNPAALIFPDGTSGPGMRQWSGTGAPSTTTIGGAAALGDVYYRRDGSAGTRWYKCKIAGTPGTWVPYA